MPPEKNLDSLSDTSSTYTAAKEALELEKLRLEIDALQKPWWTRLDHLQPISTFAVALLGTIVSILAVIIGYWHGWFDTQNTALNNQRIEATRARDDANVAADKANARKQEAQQEAAKVEQSLAELQQKRSVVDKENSALKSEQIVLKRQLQTDRDELAHVTRSVPYVKDANAPVRPGTDVYPITGKVLDDNGRPVGGVELYVEGDVGHLRLQTFTDAHGTYVLNGNSDTQSYHITFIKPGYDSPAITLPNNTNALGGEVKMTGPDGTWTHPKPVTLHKKK